MVDHVYLDNAATSWPKPPEVGRAMARFLEHDAGNPGRGGHELARRAAVPVEACREMLAGLIGAPDAKRVILTHGCTDSVNQAVHGVMQGALGRCGKDKPHAVATCAEHNAVLRTLHCYHARGLIDFDVVREQKDGVVDAEAFLAVCNERTRLACMTHASNVLGTLQPVGRIGAALRERSPRALFMVDAAQTAGHAQIDVVRDQIDLLAVAGHKGLLGPTATGCLYVGERAWPDDPEADRLFCERRGGTGAVGPGLDMPKELPDALEAGTANAVGFAGLLAAVGAALPDRHAHEMRMLTMLREGLGAIEGVTLYGRADLTAVPVVLCNLRGIGSLEAGQRLDAEFGVCARGQRHCAPLMHEAIGTWPDGALRLSPGWATTEDEIGRAIEAVRALAAE